MVDNEGTTVFMTCADEVDVKYADTVGYLRNGKILLLTQNLKDFDAQARAYIYLYFDSIMCLSRGKKLCVGVLVSSQSFF